MSVLKRMKNDPIGAERPNPDEVVPKRPTERTNALAYKPKLPRLPAYVHPALTRDADGPNPPPMPHGRPESIIEYARRRTNGGKDLFDLLKRIADGEPVVGKIITDEMGRARKDPETGEVLVEWAFPSFAAMQRAAEYLGSLGLLPQQPKVSLNVSANVPADQARRLDLLTLEEQRVLLALEQKMGQALLSGRTPTAHGEEIEGEVVDTTSEPSTEG